MDKDIREWRAARRAVEKAAKKRNEKWNQIKARIESGDLDLWKELSKADHGQAARVFGYLPLKKRKEFMDESKAPLRVTISEHGFINMRDFSIGKKRYYDVYVNRPDVKGLFHMVPIHKNYPAKPPEELVIEWYNRNFKQRSFWLDDKFVENKFKF